MQGEFITRAQQESMGLVRRAESRSFVPAIVEPKVNLPSAYSEHKTMLDVPVNALQVVSVQTTERDRSMGYLLRTIPLSFAFAIVVVAVAITLFEEPFFSWTAFIVFWLSMVGAWMFGEWRLGKSSPYSANIMEIERKWDNIDLNDKRRWDAWERATGIITPGNGEQSWIDKHKGIVITVGISAVLWMILTGLVVMAEVLE